MSDVSSEAAPEGWLKRGCTDAPLLRMRMEGCMAEEGQGSLGCPAGTRNQLTGSGVQHQPEAMDREQLRGLLQAGAEPQTPLHARSQLSVTRWVPEPVEGSGESPQGQGSGG